MSDFAISLKVGKSFSELGRTDGIVAFSVKMD